MKLYHLLEAHHALSNIALRRIKVSRFSDLNDPFELMGADLGNKDLRPIFAKTKENLHNNKGLICLSRSWANPVLWSHYGDKHRGICLGFDVSDKIHEPVNYTAKPLEVFNEENGKNKSVLSAEFMHKLSITKFEGWSYEDEHRIFVDLDLNSVESGMYFYPFSEKFKLTKVILGPRCELPIKRIRKLVSSSYSDVEVIKARIAFQSFRVIKSKSQSKLKPLK